MTKKRFAVVYAAAALLAGAGLCQSSELRFCIRSDPGTFNPLLVDDEPAEAVRYLTGGVLIRLNRVTQQLEPELASSWSVDRGARSIRFEIRQGVRFSDGTPFEPRDVVDTFTALMDPKLHSPVADPFRSNAGPVRAAISGPHQVTVTFPAPVAGLERLFDQVAMVSSRSPHRDRASLGPFCLRDYRPGVEVVLQRNPYYWKRDAAGRPYPYLDSVRLEIQQNRQLEALRFLRGELDMIGDLSPDLFESIRRKRPEAARDLGPGLDSEMLWFNQVPTAPIPEYRKAWFRSRAFRVAVSQAINRADLCRLVYLGHAAPAAGPLPAADRFWTNARLKPLPYDPADALKQLRADGFVLRQGVLFDAADHPVEFSVVTNAGNRAREQMALLIQQDLRKVGIRMQVVTLDFPSLIERIARTYGYDAALLGLTNLDLDPNGQMNVWLSSAANHQWNPNQARPATPWEAEIDRLMRAQAALPDRNARKRLFDRVQQIVFDNAPFLYLVNKDVLVAQAPTLRNARAGVLQPYLYSEPEQLEVLSNLVSLRRSR